MLVPLGTRPPGPLQRVGKTIRPVHFVVAERWSVAARRKERLSSVSPAVVLATFPLVFIAELPDRSMFASLVMAARGRPLQVWLGAAAAFALHVTIAVTLGAALFALVPRRVVEAVVAAGFCTGAVLAWRASRSGRREEVEVAPGAHRAVLGAFAVLFVAEWGDLTQIVTANLAARYGDPLSVGVGAVVALWAVAALAVTGGRTLLKLVDPRSANRFTAAVLSVLAGYAVWLAVS